MGLSPSPMELAFLAVLALVILGPNRLPEAARSLGKGFREMRDSFQGAVDGHDEEDDRFDLEALSQEDDEDEDVEEPELSEAEKKAEARRAESPDDESKDHAEDDSSGEDDHQNEADSSVPSASSSSTERE